MNVQNFKPRTGFLVTKPEQTKSTSTSGLQIEENSDDFLVYATVISSASTSYPPGTQVVFEALNAQSFRDGAESYNLIHEDVIVGTLT